MAVSLVLNRDLWNIYNLAMGEILSNVLTMVPALEPAGYRKTKGKKNTYTGNSLELLAAVYRSVDLLESNDKICVPCISV